MLRRLSLWPLLALAPAAFAQSTFTSKPTGGLWADPNTWLENNAPTTNWPGKNSDLDTVTVGIGHLVWTSPHGVQAGAIKLEQLTVFGEIVSAEDGGFGQNMEFHVNTLAIKPSGWLHARAGYGFGGNNYGGAVIIKGQTQLDAAIQGRVTGGDGDCGGYVWIVGYDDDGFVLPISNILSTNGYFEGGMAGGEVTLGADTVTINGGLVKGGDTDAAHPGCCAGSVFIFSDSSTTVKGSAVVSAGNRQPVFTPGCGGDIYISSLGSLNLVSPAILTADSGDIVGWGGLSVSCSALVAAPNGAVKIDPPDIRLTGNGKWQADRVSIGGQNFKADALTGAHAIDAASSLEIFVNPGGSLDLRGLTPGTQWFRAGESITLHADGAILLPPGVALNELMGPAVPVVAAPEAFREISLSPQLPNIGLRPGQTYTLPLSATNSGSIAEQLLVNVSDTTGWLTTPITNLPAPVGVGASFRESAVIHVPTDAQQSDSSVLTFSTVTTTAGQAAIQKTVSITLKIRNLCPLDFNGDGFLSGDDFDLFVQAFVDGDPIADYNRDGFISGDDFDAYVRAFGFGCP